MFTILITIAIVGKPIAIKKRSKELIQKMKQKIRAITLQGTIEKNYNFDSTIIISHFGCTNNIFTDSTILIGRIPYF